MKRIMLGTCLALFALSPAFAEEPLAAFFGNTLIVKDAKGERKMWYRPDHSYTGVDQGGKKTAGTWDIKDNQICTQRTEPPPEQNHGPHCKPIPTGKKVGDSWDGVNHDGQPVTYRLVAGS